MSNKYFFCFIIVQSQMSLVLDIPYKLKKTSTSSDRHRLECFIRYDYLNALCS